MTPLRPIARRALATQSDDRLVRLLREGHGPAFEEIVRRYRDPLVAFATAIVSHGRAEDVVQASLLRAHRALTADDREIDLRPWLFTIVRNGALNVIRAEPITDELGPASAVVPSPSEAAERSEELDRLVVAICALPASQRQALVKRELEGVGHAEIAAELGTSATAVRGLIFRARTTLRDAIGAAVPLPLLRALLAQGPAAAGVAGGGAGAGAGAAMLGGAGAKGATMVAAAIIALGTGIAIDRGHRGSDDGRAEAEVRADSQQPRTAPAGDDRPMAAATASAASATGSDAGGGDGASDGPGPGEQPGSEGTTGSGGGPGSGGDSTGSPASDASPGSSGPSGSGGSSGSGGAGPAAEEEQPSGSGSSGPGGGEIEGGGSGSSGSSGSGSEGPSGSSGPGSGFEPVYEPPESSNSGPGSLPDDPLEIDPPEVEGGGGHGPH